MIYSIGVAFIIFTMQSLISMQPTEPKPVLHSFTLVTDEKPPKKFPLSFEVAMQCQTIKEMISDLIPEDQKEPVAIEIPISESFRNGIPCFLDYAQLVSSLNIEPEKSEEYTKIDKKLSLYSRTLLDSELIDLFVLVDYLNVIDRNKNGHLTQAVANKIIKGSTNLESFYHLNGRTLFRNVIKKVNKEVNLTQKLIQPYSDELIARHQLVRTIPISTALYYNIRNLVAAPFRVIGLLPFIGPFPWSAKTILKPQYLNNQTGTMITSFTNKLNSSNITHLLITKIGTNQKIIIPINNSDLSEITAIESNKEESIFICRSKNKAIVINLLDVANPIIIDHYCRDYVFSNNSDELYAINSSQFGIVSLSKNNFTVLHDFKNKFCHAIKTNKKANLVALSINRQKVWIWKKSDLSMKEIFSDRYNSESIIEIYNMCLHPTKDLLYVQYQGKHSIDTKRIDINSLERKDLSVRIGNQGIEKGNIFQFLPNSDDILFIGTPQNKDYFFNTKTNHWWSKEKNKSDQRMWLINNKDDNYERIALTADCQQSIEQRKENSLILDVMMFLITKGNEETPNISPTKISLVSLIDNAVIEAVQKINKGFLPLSVIQKLKNQPANNPHDENISPQMQKIIDASDTNNQWKWRWAKNIFYFVASCGAFILKVKPKWGQIDTSSAARALAAVVVVGYCIERAIAQY